MRVVEKAFALHEDTDSLHADSRAFKSGLDNEKRFTHQSTFGMVEYIDELDRAKHVIQQLPKETPINQERLARQIGHREREAYLNLNIPGGKRRNHMPAVPEKS